MLVSMTRRGVMGCSDEWAARSIGACAKATGHFPPRMSPAFGSSLISLREAPDGLGTVRLRLEGRTVEQMEGRGDRFKSGADFVYGAMRPINRVSPSGRADVQRRSTSATPSVDVPLGWPRPCRRHSSTSRVSSPKRQQLSQQQWARLQQLPPMSAPCAPMTSA